MCLSLPGKIITLINNDNIAMAVVDFGGVRRDICTEWVPEVKAGDYVLVHVGTALTIIDKETALENIATLNEISKGLNREENIQTKI